MKQFITYDQVYSLGQTGKQKLRDWFHTKSEQEKMLTKMHYADGALPLLSIGQMIEFLEDSGSHWWSLQENEVNVFVGEKPDNYEGSYTYYFNGDQYRGFSVCDALWEAVKQILEEEHVKE